MGIEPSRMVAGHLDQVGVWPGAGRIKHHQNFMVWMGLRRLVEAAGTQQLGAREAAPLPKKEDLRAGRSLPGVRRRRPASGRRHIPRTARGHLGRRMAEEVSSHVPATREESNQTAAKAHGSGGGTNS